MARNVIVLKGRGHFFEGTLASGQTPKPGQCVSLKSDGLYEAWNGAADGERDEVLIVREDELLGRTVNDAYAAGGRVYLYAPQPGDEFQVLVASGETPATGSKLIIDDSTGKCLVTTGSPEMEPFKVLEGAATLGADTLVLVRFLG